MARGKYGARAVNRAAAVDNDVIASLREKLAAAQLELNACKQQLHETESSFHAEVRRAVAQEISTERTAMGAQLEALSDEAVSAKRAIAEEVTALMVETLCIFDERLVELGQDPQFDGFMPRPCFDRWDSGRPSLMRLFQAIAPTECGRLMQRITTLDGRYPGSHNRERSRRNFAQMKADRNFRDNTKKMPSSSGFKKQFLAKVTANEQEA